MGAIGFVENAGAGLGAFRGHANRVEPAAYVDLGMRLPAEVAGCRPIGGFQIPLQNGEPRVAALDDEPMHRIRGHRSANLALKLSQCSHNEQFCLDDAIFEMDTESLSQNSVRRANESFESRVPS